MSVSDLGCGHESAVDWPYLCAEVSPAPSTSAAQTRSDTSGSTTKNHRAWSWSAHRQMALCSGAVKLLIIIWHIFFARESRGPNRGPEGGSGVVYCVGMFDQRVTLITCI